MEGAVSMTVEEWNKKVQYVLDFYSYIPQDVQEAINVVMEKRKLWQS